MKNNFLIKTVSVLLAMTFTVSSFISCDKKVTEDEVKDHNGLTEKGESNHTFKVFEEVVYVSDIEILNDDLLQSNGKKYAIVNLDSNGCGEYQIEWRVIPDNATNTGVNFNYDTSKKSVSVDENGLVKFTNQCAIEVSLNPNDGSIFPEPVQLMIVAIKKD